MSKYIMLILMLAFIMLLAGCSKTNTASPEFPPAAVQSSQAEPSSPSAASQSPEAVNPGQPISSSSKSLPVGSIQSSKAGNVTIDISLNEVKDDSIVFNVVMDTHSVDLDKYDLSLLSLLRDEKDNKYNPVSWQAPPGGHHRSGVLTLPLPPTISTGQTRYIELVVKDVSGIPQRVFRCETR